MVSTGVCYPHNVQWLFQKRNLTHNYSLYSNTAKHFHVNFYNHPCVTQECVPLASWPKSSYSAQGERSFQPEGHGSSHSTWLRSALYRSNSFVRFSATTYTVVVTSLFKSNSLMDQGCSLRLYSGGS